MPTITVSFLDLKKLIGKEISKDELVEYLTYAKGEIEDYIPEKDELKLSFEDTNVPYLWCAEGVARLIKGLMGIEKDLPKIKITSSDKEIIVDESIQKIRPYIGAFIAKGKGVDEHLLNQIIQFQEKFTDAYGRKRKKVSIGVYCFDKIKFLATYKAVKPESVSFVPLEYEHKINLVDILNLHPKGVMYKKTLDGFDKYPISMDAKEKVLSFPPIINSNDLGKVTIGQKELFIESCGTCLESTELAITLLAYMLYERGFKIEGLTIKYPKEKRVSPNLNYESKKILSQQVKQLFGLELSKDEIKKLAQKMRYGYKAGSIIIPPYRKDIMHDVDIIEDIGIAYGYDKIEPLPLKTLTVGKVCPITEFLDKARISMIGLGYTEIMSHMLTNIDQLYKDMNIEDTGTIEIEEFYSQSYSVVRSWVLPDLMDVFKKNMHTECPQAIFAQGTVLRKKGGQPVECEMLSCALMSSDSNFTKIKQVFDALSKAIGFSYEIKQIEHNSFIKGRCGRISVGNIDVAYIGELHPKVLENFGIDLPVAGFELNLTELFKLVKN